MSKKILLIVFLLISVAITVYAFNLSPTHTTTTTTLVLTKPEALQFIETYDLFDIAKIVILLLGFIATSKGLEANTEQRKASTQQHRDNHEWNRRIETQKYLSSFSSMVGDLTELNQEIDKITNKSTNKINIENLVELFKNKHKLELRCYRLLNHYEGLAIGCKMGVYDEDIVKVSRKFHMNRLYYKYKPFIEHLQAIKGKTLYCEFGDILKKWKREDKEHDEEKSKKRLGD